MSTLLADAIAGALRTVELEVAAEEAREVELTQAERWARDPVGWIEAYGWIASKFAGKRGRVGPMRLRLFPDQKRTIAAWIDLPHLEETGELVFRNLAVEKSRQIGETWLFALLALWALLFHAVQGLALHRKAAEVADRGFSIKSLFGRVRYAYSRLDAAAIPPRAKLRFHPFSVDPAKIVNEGNGAVLHGEAQSDDPGRGGTFDFVLGDEFAFVLHGESVYAAIDAACPDGKALLSTPNGSDNAHARICDEEPEGWTYLRLHWSTHPVYARGLHVAAVGPLDGRPGRHSPQDPAMAEVAHACELCAGTIAGLKWASKAPRAHRFPGKLASPWYDRAVIGKTVEQVASELDIDRERSLTARVYDEFDSTVHVHRDPAGREAPIAYDPALPVELSFDYGLDCTAVTVCQDAPGEYRVIGEVELVDRPGETPTPDNVARALLQELLELGVPPAFLTAQWTRRMYARGDPAGDARTLATGRPLTADYRREGFDIKPPPSYLTREAATSIQAVKSLLLGHPKPLRVSSRCQRFIRHMRHNRWPTDAEGHRRVGSTLPVDNEHNHMMRSFAYLAVAKFPPGRSGHQGTVGEDDTWDTGDQDDAYGGSVWGSLAAAAETLPYDSPA